MFHLRTMFKDCQRFGIYTPGTFSILLALTIVDRFYIFHFNDLLEAGILKFGRNENIYQGHESII